MYIHFERSDDPRKKGVLNKINGQLKAFQKKGISTDLVYLKNKRQLYFNDELLTYVIYRHFLGRYLLFFSILKRIKNSDYSLIYIRYPQSDRYFLWFLSKIKKSETKVFLEFPTYPYDKECSKRKKLDQILLNQDRKYRIRLKPLVYRCITYTTDTTIFNIPTIRLSNGIDLSKYNVVSNVSKSKDTIKLIAVANLTKSQGYDRLIKGLKVYYSQSAPHKTITLNIIGNGPAYHELQLLTKDLKLEEYVIFKGIKMSTELDKEFESSDLGIGTLAIHRVGLHSGSVLKVREYLARGIPSVIGYKDTGIQDNLPFIFKVEANETPINISELVSFMEGLQISPLEIRQYAIENLGWEKQINKIIHCLYT